MQPQRIRRAGWWVKQSFSNDFVHALEDLYDKYGEEVFEVQGIAHKNTDLAEFSRSFFSKSTKNVASVSIDQNANVKEKNIAQYNFENNKAMMKLNSFYLMFTKIRDLFGYDSAVKALDKILNGEIFLSDATNFSLAYCFSFDLRELLMSGMNFFQGNMKINPPKRSESFFALLIQTTAYISNQIMGAGSYPSFFPILDKFYREEMGENYMKNIRSASSSEWLSNIKRMRNQFQNFIYSMNFPLRGSQSVFTNISVMDRGFMEALFSDFLFPDMTRPNIESSIELSKYFFEYFNEIYCVEGVFTFPVMTIAISLDEQNEYIDSDFVDWAAKVNSEKSIANVFQSKPNAFSSCCRLKNEFDKVADSGYQNSFGVGGLSIGSHRVCGLNLPRIALLEDKNKNTLMDALDVCHKILLAHRDIIKERIDGGFLPLYTHGWMHLKKQYSTIGFVGAYEYLVNKKLSIKNKNGIKEVLNVLGTIETKIKEWQIEEKEHGNIYNIEQIPAESMAVRLARLDSILGFNPNKFIMYSNQYIPLVERASIYDRFKIQGQIDAHTSGGAILHLNVDDEISIPAERFKEIMNVARQTGTVYFAVNYAYSECAGGHYIVGKKNECPICQKEIINQFTRVVGFITPVNSWQETRKEWEYPKRVFHTNEELKEVIEKKEKK